MNLLSNNETTTTERYCYSTVVEIDPRLQLLESNTPPVCNCRANKREITPICDKRANKKSAQKERLK